MIDLHFAVPGDIASPTGGYAYARAVLAGLPAAGVRAHHIVLPATFPYPDANDLAEAERQFLAVPSTGILLIDGLAFGALPAAVVAALPQKLIALVHHPLAFESGTPPDVAARLHVSEQAALQHADKVIASSPTTARELETQFAVAVEKLSIAVPGVAAARRARGSGGPGTTVLAVGAVSTRKGYDVLVDAMARCPNTDWTLTIAGSLDRNRDVADRLCQQIATAGLGDRITLAGTVSDDGLDQLYDSADLFVLSSRYEGYGMVLTEALARGLAIVSTTGGAAAETVPDEAALKVPSDNAAALADALARATADSALRHRLSDAAWRHAAGLPRWQDTIAAIAAVVKELA